MVNGTWRIQKLVVVMLGAVLVFGGLAPAARAEDGKAIYDKNCVSCHGAGGKGDGPVGKALKPPPGDFAATLKAVSADDMTKLIKEGGKPVGKNHPAFGKKLSDADVAAVVQYVKQLAGQ